MDGRMMYVLNLNQRRLIVVCALLSGLLGTSFGLGLLLGVRSNAAKPGSIVKTQLIPVAESSRNNPLLPATMDRTPVRNEAPTAQEASRMSHTEVVKPPTSVSKTSPPRVSTKKKARTRTVPKNLPGYKPSLNIQLFVTKDLHRIRMLESELQKKNYKAGIVPVGKGVYALKVGPYSDKAEAEADLQIFRSKTSFSDAFLRVAYHKE